MAGCLLLLASCSDRSVTGNHGIIPFNNNWQFALLPLGEIPEDYDWQDVVLPHTPRIEKLVMSEKQWQGTCTYRKIFDSPDKTGDKYIALRFGAAMHEAKVYFNNELITTHSGGYLPFTVNLSGKLKPTGNTLLVEINNEDNKDIPPGKPISGLDFCYYGGLYRNVDLIVKNPVHITDPLSSTTVAGGGLYITQDSCCDGKRKLHVNVEIANSFDSEKSIYAQYRLTTPRDSVFTGLLALIVPDQGETAVMKGEILISNPLLWSPENPSLYELEITLKEKGEIYDRQTINIGLRDIAFDKDGFCLNGEPYKIRGTNRHQEYPYVGYAIGENADYRDARKIKKAGFNFVRLSHYPHSESFLDACDELGLLVMDAIPGWQFVGDSIFRENSKKDLRDMIRRDRNHPSIFFWSERMW